MPDEKQEEKSETKTKSDAPVDVAGIVENAFFLGLGALEVTREQVTKFTGDLVDRGKMSQGDAKKVADDMTQMAKKQQEAVRSVVTKETDRAMKASGVATKSDVDSLREEIAELKKLLAAQAAGKKPTAE